MVIIISKNYSAITVKYYVIKNNTNRIAAPLPEPDLLVDTEECSKSFMPSDNICLNIQHVAKVFATLVTRFSN